MTLSHDAILELMGLVDGELDDDARARAEATLAASEEARQLVASMRTSPVGAWLRETLSERASGAGAGIAEAVMAKLGANGEDGTGLGRISIMRARRSLRTRAAFAAAGGALALAAGVAIFAHSTMKPPEPLAVAPAPTIPTVVKAAPVAVAEQAAQPPIAGVEVDDIDAPSRGVSVYEIPLGGAAAAMVGSSHASSVVIWVDDDPARK